MTTPDPHGHAAHGTHHASGPATEPERIAMVPVIAVGLISVLVFAFGSVWALRIRSTTERAMNPAGRLALPQGYGAEEQGIIDQIPFELNTWVATDRKENGAKLQGYRWLDAKAGTLHVPIERAMELVVEESRK